MKNRWMLSPAPLSLSPLSLFTVHSGTPEEELEGATVCAAVRTSLPPLLRPHQGDWESLGPTAAAGCKTGGGNEITVIKRYSH